MGFQRELAPFGRGVGDSVPQHQCAYFTRGLLKSDIKKRAIQVALIALKPFAVRTGERGGFMKNGGKNDEKKEPDNRKRVHLVSGQWVLKDNNVIGYCSYKLHKGCVTKKLLKDHQCLEKNCPFLQKYKDVPYWKEREKAIQSKNQRKQKKKDIKKHEEECREFLLSSANGLLDKMQLDIEIIEIKFIASEKKVVIFYISDSPFDDSVYFREFVRRYAVVISTRTEYICSKVEARHIKDTDGRYVTFSDRCTCGNKWIKK